MKLLKNIFIALLAVVFTTTSSVAVQNCNNAKYRSTHPYKCRSYEQKYTANNTAFAVIGGAALVGVGVALAAQTHGDSGSSSTISNQNTFPRLTLSSDIHINYDQNEKINNQRLASYYTHSLTNGSDIESSVINNIKTSEKYQTNKKQYDAIKFAWANARGFSGKHTAINIFDDFKSTHGAIVNDITHNIANDSNIRTYNIATAPATLGTFDYIANTINSAKVADIYNASWQIESTSVRNAATVIYNGTSIKTYAEAQQYLYDLSSKNFITQIR